MVTTTANNKNNLSFKISEEPKSASGFLLLWFFLFVWLFSSQEEKVLLLMKYRNA